MSHLLSAFVEEPSTCNGFKPSLARILLQNTQMLKHQTADLLLFHSFQHPLSFRNLF